MRYLFRRIRPEDAHIHRMGMTHIMTRLVLVTAFVTSGLYEVVDILPCVRALLHGHNAVTQASASTQ